MSENGRLTPQELAPIPGGQLRKDAARAWNAMCERARELGLPVPMPDGPLSSYRTFVQQVQLRVMWCARGNCDNAAKPGTSRHGWGIAVDVAEDAVHHAATIDKIGEPYGWSKKWSDAPWEPWHNTWDEGHVRVLHWWTPFYKRGSYGPNVMLLTGRLQHLGYLHRRYWRYQLPVVGAVRAFQRDHGLPLGATNRETWYAIKRWAAAK